MYFTGYVLNFLCSMIFYFVVCVMTPAVLRHTSHAYIQTSFLVGTEHFREIAGTNSRGERLGRARLPY